MGELLLTLRRDGSTVHLVAVAIVVRLSLEELASLVAAGAICIPLVEDIQELFIRLRLCGTVDVDVTAVRWLARLILGKSNVAILLISKGNQAAWCC